MNKNLCEGKIHENLFISRASSKIMNVEFKNNRSEFHE